jgi:3-hydroxyisobutyrate dehydrogenase
MRAAIVGCGVVGGELLALGHEVAVFDLREEVVANLVRLGAHGAGSAAEAAAFGKFTVLSLARGDDVIDSFHGPHGILAGLTGGEVILEASTVPARS